jgi:sugar phosphate permease
MVGRSLWDDRRELSRNLLLDGTAGAGLGAAAALLFTLLPAAARVAGMDPLGLAIIVALPFAAAAVGTLAGSFGPRSPRQLALLRLAGAAALAIALFDPEPTWILVATGSFWVTYMAGMPLQQRLWAAMYPRGRRGTLLGIVGTARFAGAGVAILVVGPMAHGPDGLKVVLMASAVVAAFALATAGLAINAPVAAAGYSARASIATALMPRIRRLTLAQLVFGGALIAAAPLITLVQVDRAALSMAEIGLAGAAGALSATLSFGVCGVAADRSGARRVVSVAVSLGVLALLLFGSAGSLSAVLVATVLMSVSVSAVEMVIPVHIADHAAAHEQAAAAAGMNAIWGLRGLIVPFVAVWPIHSGLMDVTGMLLVCAVVLAAGALLFVRAVDQPAPKADRTADPEIIARAMVEAEAGA